MIQFMIPFDVRFSPQDSLLGGKAVLEMLAVKTRGFVVYLKVINLAVLILPDHWMSR